jgi:hypothetical protein
MNGPRDPDAIIAAWLEEGPDRLPPITRQVVVSSIHLTPQRRKPRWWLPWPSISTHSAPGRYTQMSTVMRIALASILTIAVGGAIYGGYRFATVSDPTASSAPVAAPASPSTAPTTTGAGNAWVTGSMSCTGSLGSPQISDQGVEQYRSMAYTCYFTASDPRLAGRFTETAGADCHPLTPADTGCVGVSWGTFEGPDWIGPVIATIDPADHVSMQITLTGTGANAGWTFVGFVDGDTGDFSGSLYQGLPPTVPSPSPSPAE